MRILFAVLAVAIAGCKQTPELPAVISPYKIDIQQGNVVTQEMVAKLKAGMTRSQVRFVLGSPLVVDPFHTDRWDYVYSYQKQGKPAERRRLTVIFDGDKLILLGGDVVQTDTALPVEKPAAPQPAPAPAAKSQPLVAEKPAPPKPAAAVPAAKTAEKLPAALVPPAPKPETGKPDGAKPAAATAAKPAAIKPEAVKAGAAADTAGSGAAPPAEAAKAANAKPDAKPETAVGEVPKTDEKKEIPKERGFFGRMLDKIGF